MTISPPQFLSHPHRYKEFLGKARGITVLVDTLREFCPSNMLSEVIWPGYEVEMDWAIQPDTRLRKKLGIGLDNRVIVYTGNVHSANRKEVFSLYLAVGLLNQRGITTRIVRTGKNFIPLFDESLEVLKDFSINLGHVKRRELPAILSLADALVQPGRADKFNNYRFPSKLPEYLASGKPVLLPATNIGCYLKDGEECILLQQGHALEISQKLELLWQDKVLGKKIGDAGRKFAERNLRWDQSAEKLHSFYQRLLADIGKDAVAILSQPLPVGTKHTWRDNMTSKDKIIQRYRGISMPTLSYATVRDYCDSADNLAQVMRFDGDLKDVQRPWMLKSILGVLPPGAKLLEIGAGEPLVANVLEKLGYDVTIVDPYDGSGNGPQEYIQYSRDYSNIKIIKSYFKKDILTLTKNTFDCVFSISVLEHVPHENLQDVFAGITQFLKHGGISIHCTDNVISGQRADWHDKGVREILFWQSKLQTSNLDDGQIRQQVDGMINEFYQKMAGDVETYYLSAQGHNLWRGGQPYNNFPFSKIVSTQTCVTKK